MDSSNNTLRVAHRLHHDDRARLMRSTRKIGEVVGETPQLVDLASNPPVPSRHRRKPSLDYYYNELPQPTANNSAASASIARPVLYIRLPEPDPTSSSFLRPPTMTPTPPSPSPTLTANRKPRSPVGAVRRYGVTVKDESARRRTMAKLSRTLGERVPPALVFPPESERQQREERLARRLTVRSLKSDKGSVRSGRESIVSTSRVSREREKRKRSRTATGRENDISHGWVWVGRPEDIPAGVKVKVKPHRRRRADSGAPFNWYPSLQVEEAEEEDPNDTPSELSTQLSPYTSYTNSSLRVQRREEGWSGEWVGGVQNMDEVLRGLRSLKVK
ncbi:hypothetical protein C8F01DRAFT_1143294 [Mycena amicta]|nr:hypothetical protein C8F01DRAFT_1143294 [Mycena amicta]